MDKLRALVVEDDDADASALVRAIGRYGREGGIGISVDREPSAFSLDDIVDSYDLVFLDIDLPGINGMEAAEALREHSSDVPLVFVTNLAQYAVHGYAVDALDFLVKPISQVSVTAALDKAVRMARRRKRATYVVQSEGQTVVLRVPELAYVEVNAHDLLFHLEDGSTVSSRGTLAAVERDLADAPFVRISSSFLVNMEGIRRVRRDSLVMDNGEELWFSRGKRRAAMRAIAEYLGGTV